MATKRRPIERPFRARITPELIELWRRIRAIQAADLDEVWEDAGGRRREYLDATVELHGGLGLTPWHDSPAEVASEGPPPAWDNGSYTIAQQWRRALEEAAAE